ncbi:hypothetical protein EJ06DRAFT_566021 [Trichodelitschia bisporula]|uniref:Uncharacterized protein n=1 Tax=Trichodelitschia bisporula TaxID=703511 RepID=A0A6G1HPP7_9PEZI|nr:hypothetical protein EJ06DRAFT_566021 [Trichodelitschia bisporula]
MAPYYNVVKCAMAARKIEELTLPSQRAAWPVQDADRYWLPAYAQSAKEDDDDDENDDSHDLLNEPPSSPVLDPRAAKDDIMNDLIKDFKRHSTRSSVAERKTPPAQWVEKTASPSGEDVRTESSRESTPNYIRKTLTPEALTPKTPTPPGHLAVACDILSPLRRNQ